MKMRNVHSGYEVDSDEWMTLVCEGLKAWTLETLNDGFTQDLPEGLVWSTVEQSMVDSVRLSCANWRPVMKEVQ